MAMLNCDEKETYFMDEAFRLAEEALVNDEVPVGCVFVINGQEVARGRNEVNLTGDPTAHAEMVAIRRLRNRPDFKAMAEEMELFVTLEPCIMCAAAMYELKIKRIVYGAANQRFGGVDSVGGRRKYQSQHEIEIKPLVAPERSIELLKKFYDLENPNAPIEKRKIKKTTVESK